MYQAIKTEAFGPTNQRQARVKAMAEAGSLFVPWDFSLGIEGNHTAAMQALVAKLGWTWGGEWVGGAINGGFVFVWRRSEATIVVLTEGGVIQDVLGMPPGVKVEVRDFDVEGVEPDRLSVDPDGNQYVGSVWE